MARYTHSYGYSVHIQCGLCCVSLRSAFAYYLKDKLHGNKSACFSEVASCVREQLDNLMIIPGK